MSQRDNVKTDLKEIDEVVQNGLIWLRIGTSGWPGPLTNLVSSTK